MKYKQHKENISGNDYIIGDIHGEFNTLEEILKEIDFNTSKDRLFSVGDLVNRGEHSYKIFQWMDYEWFHPISGNHEKMVLEILENPNTLFAHKFTTVLGKWLNTLNDKEKDKLKKYFRSLPILQTVKLKKNTIGMVHAFIPDLNWKYTVENINNIDIQNYCLETLDSQLFTESDVIKGIDFLYVGHVPQIDINKKSNLFMIDTGSGYKGRKISILNLNTNKKLN